SICPFTFLLLFTDSATTHIYTLSLHDALPIFDQLPQTHAATFALIQRMAQAGLTDKPLSLSGAIPETVPFLADTRYLLARKGTRSEEHTSELQSRENLVCRLLLEKKKNKRLIT